MLFPILGSSSLPIVVAQPDERHENRTAMCWSGMTYSCRRSNVFGDAGF